MKRISTGSFHTSSGTYRRTELKAFFFQPPTNGDPFSAEKMTAYIGGLDVPVGQPGWRRAWFAEGVAGEIIGHIDLRARPEPCTEHRALLGMGVSSTCRRAGIGRKLAEFVFCWARESSVIDTIDLAVLSCNLPAIRLYEGLGFTKVSEIPDMFTINGAVHGDIQMTKPMQSA